MPGSYEAYLDALENICEFVAKEHPSKAELNAWLKRQYKITDKGADERTRFLLRAEVLLMSDSGQLDLADTTRHWNEIGDDGLLISLLHSRTKFFGEMLAELSDKPLPTEELRKTTRRYGLTWDSQTQINYRRGWLQSAKLLKVVDKRHLAITDAGRDLLAKLTIHRPGFEPTGPATPELLLNKTRGGSNYRSPSRQEAIERRRVFEVDPDLVDRGTAAHMDVQDELAEAIRSAGAEPRSPAPHDPQFDVAWQIGDSAFVAEVKSLTEENEDRQLRLGLGQVLSYAFLLDWPGANDVQPVLAVERPPTNEYWGGLCKEHGVILTWPDEFKDLFN